MDCGSSPQRLLVATDVTARSKKLLAHGAAVAVLLAVFALYTRPRILVTLADQFWACFN